MNRLVVVLALVGSFILACGGASDQLEASQKLMDFNAKLDPTGTTGCLAECMKLSTKAMELAEAGDSSGSIEMSQKAMACQSRCEEGGGTAAAAASGTGDNTTGCLAGCMEYSTKAMKLAEAGDASGSMAMSQKAMECQATCE